MIDEGLKGGGDVCEVVVECRGEKGDLVQEVDGVLIHEGKMVEDEGASAGDEARCM